ncbi:MAG: hypothetical protein CSA38_00670 [Flavobacteriales bacterium]|nr:MAG: hypothetical protein CSA38_00670 [Flavobacteriales bacterium]
MNRKEFIKKCGFACLGAGLSVSLLESCIARGVTGKIVNTDINVPLDSFKDKNYIVVENEMLQYPIFVHKTSETEYSAVLMQCTHQGAELQAFGDTLECPAHGSQFDAKGNLKGGPANQDLRKFPVSINENQLKISLKNV